jgi:cytochrome c biogenesis protein CcdA/peroxiredoxin
VHGVFFVSGFTLVFVTVGLLSTAFIQQIGGENINLITGFIGRIGGAIIIFFGFHFMGVLPSIFGWLRDEEALLDSSLLTFLLGFLGSMLIAWSLTGTIALWNSPLWTSALWIPALATVFLLIYWLWLMLGGAFTAPRNFWLSAIQTVENALYSDTRRRLTASDHNGYGGSFLMGVIFSAGWTPCIGPVYGAVLTMAANGGDAGQAGVLLTAYSLGLGLPFLFTALMLDHAQGILRRLRAHMRVIELASGALLIFIGLTVASGQLQSLSQQFAGQFAEFSIGLEETVIEFVTGGSEESTNASSEAVVEDTQDTTTSQIGLEIGNLAPDFETSTDTGEPVSLSDLRGQIVLLNFWATWCGPCRVEMPVFQQQFDRYSNSGFIILAVNNSETVEDVAGFRDEFGLTFPLAMDEDGTIQNQFSIFSYPSTFVIDRSGVILARHFGPLTAEQIEQLLNQAFAS